MKNWNVGWKVWGTFLALLIAGVLLDIALLQVVGSIGIVVVLYVMTVKEEEEE